MPRMASGKVITLPLAIRGISDFVTMRYTNYFYHYHIAPNFIHRDWFRPKSRPLSKRIYRQD